VLSDYAFGHYSLQSVAAAGKECECYLGLLFTMEDVAVYGYVTPLKVKIIVALPLSDAVVKDAEIVMVSTMHNDFFARELTSTKSPGVQSTSHGILFFRFKPILDAGQIRRSCQ